VQNYAGRRLAIFSICRIIKNYSPIFKTFAVAFRWILIPYYSFSNLLQRCKSCSPGGDKEGTLGIFFRLRSIQNLKIHEGTIEEFKVSATLRDRLHADRSSFYCFYEKPYYYYAGQNSSGLTFCYIDINYNKQSYTNQHTHMWKDNMYLKNRSRKCHSRECLTETVQRFRVRWHIV